MKFTKIKDLKTSMKNVNVDFIVIKLLETNTTKDNDKVYTYLVADETGSIEASIWNILLEIGDLICIEDAYVSLFKERKRIFKSGNGNIRRIGEIKKQFRLSEEHKNLI
ncbi:SOSS complex subunit [Vairimorpha necatrix]|uniref:SOSS complex subunit n=1 Tax=Vairimorpha necatrix TaxID=6039 RepID=A0AAX4JD75_9MICR